MKRRKTIERKKKSQRKRIKTMKRNSKPKIFKKYGHLYRFFHFVI